MIDSHATARKFRARIAFIAAEENIRVGVAAAIEERREAVFQLPVRLGRDVARSAVFLDFLAKRIGVVAFVGMHHLTNARPVEKRCAGSAISTVSTRDHERNGAAEFIRKRVDFGCSPATGTADQPIS